MLTSPMDDLKGELFSIPANFLVLIGEKGLKFPLFKEV